MIAEELLCKGEGEPKNTILQSSTRGGLLDEIGNERLIARVSFVCSQLTYPCRPQMRDTLSKATALIRSRIWKCVERGTLSEAIGALGIHGGS